MAQAEPAEIGDALCDSAVDALPVVSVSDSEAEWHDVRSTAVIRPADHDVLVVGADQVPADSDIEVKAAQVWYRSQRGRFYFKVGQHGRLLDHDAWYLFEVYLPEPDKDFPVLKRAILPARLVDELIEDDWIARPDRSIGKPYQQRSWALFIDSDDVCERCPGCADRLYATDTDEIGPRGLRTCSIDCTLDLLSEGYES